MSNARRWRLFYCYMEEDREAKADAFINKMAKAGFKAKVWCPLPQHKTSGHIHVVVLCTLDEKMDLELGKGWRERDWSVKPGDDAITREVKRKNQIYRGNMRPISQIIPALRALRGEKPE